ncbi:MAG: hypothetical protein JXB25_03985 [Deltaproteobacteria bacterium]|nr:hypothetical protein [Deltaproteobacteria bacterium]
MINGIATSIHNTGSYPDPKTGAEPSSATERRFSRTATGSGAETETGRGGASSVQDQVTLSPEARQKIQELANRDREVRTHEAAHAAVGGPYAGAPRYSYQQGPDGRRYAVGGEVDIDTAKIPGDPKQTLAKAETIRRAALAPANPSAADRAIAAKAVRMAAEARSEITAEQNQKLQEILPQNVAGGGKSTTQRGHLLNLSV